jgi:hypothetical protein
MPKEKNKVINDIDLRDYFAGQAMQAIIIGMAVDKTDNEGGFNMFLYEVLDDYGSSDRSVIAENAYEIADEMLKGSHSIPKNFLGMDAYQFFAKNPGTPGRLLATKKRIDLRGTPKRERMEDRFGGMTCAEFLQIPLARLKRILGRGVGKKSIRTGKRLIKEKLNKKDPF